MKFRVLGIAAAAVCAIAFTDGETASAKDTQEIQSTDRGLIAHETGEGVFLSWRLFKEEATAAAENGLEGENFIVYRDGEKIAEVKNSTNFVDEQGSSDAEYRVKAEAADEKSEAVVPENEKYYELPLQKPEGGTTPAGEDYEYTANDMAVADMNNDGKNEYVVQWDPTNSKDVSQNGYTGNTYIDVYTMEGKLLYRVDLGKNIRSGAHYTQFLAYDFDENGQAELMMKTAPGTKVLQYDEDGNQVSEEFITMPEKDKEAGYSHEDDYRLSSEDYYEHVVDMFMEWSEYEEVKSGQWPKTLEEAFGIEQRYDYPLEREEAEELADYFMDEYAPERSDRNNLREFEGFIVDGPEYLTVFNGKTGEEMDTVDYEPGREDDGLRWGDYAMERIESGNRVDRFLAAPAYLEEDKPYAVFARGYYTRTGITAYEWDGSSLTKHWEADSGFTPMDNPFNVSPHGTDGTDEELGALAGQGNHSLSTADVDGDGSQEIIYGGATVDNDGSLLYSSSAELPEGSADPGAEAKFGHGDAMHVADIDPERDGLEIFSVFEGAANAPYGYALRAAENGEVLYGEYTGKDTGRGMIGDIVPGSRGMETWAVDLRAADGEVLDDDTPGTNMNIKWAGDGTTQIIEGSGEEAPRIVDGNGETVLEAEGTRTNNGTKGNPGLVADVYGDWREELLVRTEDSSAVRIYTNTSLTDTKMYSLMEDAQYRTGIAWQNTAYNQPAYPSFYFGSDMDWEQVPLAESSSVSYKSLQASLKQYIENDEVGRPAAKQLSNTLKQAVHHQEKGREDKALDFLEKFKQKLIKQESHLSDDAAENLTEQAKILLGEK
ncbi:rhamnogalacturonan lyase [Marinococcus halophilus]|uniref:rhamnogalacturonan lyase n=1 Tax=Marinococcus halophilus TaxID=1371 RepID=UPI0009A79A31|nr:rhamnogalacturonan lyase [Marinococcus halophilus]